MRSIVQLPSLLLGQTIGPSGTRDKGKKSGTVPEILGQLEPLTLQLFSNTGMVMYKNYLTAKVKMHTP